MAVTEGYDFLIGNTPKYNFIKARTSDVLKDAKTFWQRDNHKPCMLYDTRGEQLVLQGPYEDKQEIESIQQRLDLLVQLNVLPKNGYGACFCIPESSENKNQYWFVNEFGNELSGLQSTCSQRIARAFDSDRFFHTDQEKKCRLSARTVCQMMLISFVKRILGIGCDLETVFSPSSCDTVLPVSLEKDMEVVLKKPKHSEQTLQDVIDAHKDACSEYADYIAMYYLNEEQKQKWFELCSEYKLTLDEYSNKDHFGWPMPDKTRVMLQCSHNVNVLVPATIVHGTKHHVLYDPHICEKFLWAMVDVSHRRKFSKGDEHVDKWHIRATRMRPMTASERKLFGEIELPDVCHVYKSTSMYIGDVVKMFKQDVHDDCYVGGFDKQYKVLVEDLDNCEDVGIVMDNGKQNEFWRTVYSFKKKQLQTYPCRQLYWVKDDDGVVVRYKDAEAQLDFVTPFMMLTSLKHHFEHLL